MVEKEAENFSSRMCGTKEMSLHFPLVKLDWHASRRACLDWPMHHDSGIWGSTVPWVREVGREALWTLRVGFCGARTAALWRAWCFPTWMTCFLVEAQWPRHRFWISVVSLDVARSSMTASTTAAKGSLNWMMARSVSVWKSITRTFNQLLWQLLASRSWILNWHLPNEGSWGQFWVHYSGWSLKFVWTLVFSCLHCSRRNQWWPRFWKPMPWSESSSRCRTLPSCSDMDLDGAGIMVVTDAALGNVKADGSLGHDSSPMEKVHSQASYFVLLADKKLMAGDEGQFAILDGRSHRLQRVCRSTFGSELLGTEEAFDVGQYCRGIWACVKGRDLRQRQVDNSLNSVGLAGVTDAKDVYDKGSSDTATYGSQKALAFTVAWIRDVLRRPQTCLKWTSTENMFADAGTKEMDQSHLQRILMSGRWSVKYRPAFVKQTNKGSVKIQQTSGSELVVGKPLKKGDVVFNYLHQLGENPGWHFK